MTTEAPVWIAERSTVNKVLITVAGPASLLVAFAVYRLVAPEPRRGALDGPAMIMLFVCIGFFGLVGLAVTATIPAYWRRRGMLIDVRGFRAVRGRKSFDFAWAEISAIAISYAVSQGDPTSAVPKSLKDHKLVRVDFWPATPHFTAAHPATTRLWNRLGATDHYRMGLGPKGGIVPVLDRALGRFAGARYRGILDDGYSNPANLA